MMRTRSHGTAREDAERTRAKLVAAGIREFARSGYEQANLRDISSSAGVNLAMISYHFDGKAGLYDNVVRDVVRQVSDVFNDAYQNADLQLLQPEIEPKRQALAGLLRPFLEMATQEFPPDWGWILMREQLQPSKAFKLVHEGVVERFLRTVAALRASIDNRQPDHDDMLRAIAMYGEVMVFISAKASVQILMNDMSAEVRGVESLTRTIIDRHLA